MSEQPNDPSSPDFGLHGGANGAAPPWRSEFEPSPEPQPVAAVASPEIEVAEPRADEASEAPVVAPFVPLDAPFVPLVAPLMATSEGAGPPNGNNGTASSYLAPEPPPHDKELGLFDHLMELRTRLIRSFIYMGIGTTITWCFGEQISNFFFKPVKTVLLHHGTLVTSGPTEGFMAYFQLSFVFGLIFTAPFVMYEMWAFIEPALTRKERRYTTTLLPFSIMLFVAGCAFGYALSPMFFKFFLGYQPKDTAAFYSLDNTITFQGRIILLFGACFQVPVITIFLNKIGLVSRNWLIEYWRHVVVVIFSVVSIVTPTWDPLTLVICSVPPCLLYVLSLWIIKWLP